VPAPAPVPAPARALSNQTPTASHR
jgi:hypothetical protein